METLSAEDPPDRGSDRRGSDPLPRLSVITIVFNDREGLAATRDSVLKQHFDALQHVVVDGGSTDGTARWLESHGAARAFSWISEPDRGIYDAMNKGARIATGEYIVFLNAGDTFPSERTVEDCMARMSDLSASWGVGVSRMLDYNGRPVRLHMNLPVRRVYFNLGIKSFPHQAVIMRRSFFLRLDGFDEKWGLCADQELLFRAYMETPPAPLFTIVADCDANGVSSTQAFGAFAQQMGRIRRYHGRALARSRLVDWIAATILSRTLKIIIGGRKRIGAHVSD